MPLPDKLPQLKARSAPRRQRKAFELFIHPFNPYPQLHAEPAPFQAHFLTSLGLKKPGHVTGRRRRLLSHRDVERHDNAEVNGIDADRLDQRQHDGHDQNDCGGATLQITVPNNFPMPAVRAIAKAPQNVTRAVARRTLAPPTLAPIAPSKARKPKDAADTIGTSVPAGDTTTMSKGMAAPTENVAAEVSAACTGRAVVISEIPSSSRAWAVKASFAISCWATCRASV